MVRHAIGSMILAASILAVPVLAATPPDDTLGNSPAGASHAMPPSNSMSAGMPGSQTTHTPPVTGPASQPSAPLYTTADGQVRLGKVVGAGVYNDQHQSIGSIDDVLMSSDHKATTAVISVGGFLGIGSKLVSVPFDQLQIGKQYIVMPGATKASLESMPNFKFDNNA